MAQTRRNDPCPCGSGRRFKDCCGRLAHSQDADSLPPAGLAPLIARAQAEIRAGNREDAAQLLQQALSIAPDEANAHHLLAVVYSATGRIAEAFRHVRRAGELTGWRIEQVNHNYGYVVRIALADVEGARVAALRARYAQRHGSGPLLPQAAAGATVSVLLYAGDDRDAVADALEALKSLPAPVAEILVPAKLAGLAAGQRPDAPLRITAVAASNDHQCLNELALNARGTHLLALAARSTSPGAGARYAGNRDMLQERMASLVPLPDRWTVGVDAGALSPQGSALLAESATFGFALLSREDFVAEESSLLVPRALHERIDGYRPGSRHPLLDYCLRLLWEAEPEFRPYQAQAGTPGHASRAALPGKGSESRTRADTVDEAKHAARLAVLDDYLRLALTDAPARNAFAPSRLAWGLHLHDHLARQGLFPSQPCITAMNDDIAAHLSRLAAQRIEGLPGLNLVGPLRGEMGLGENMRAFARACLADGIPCALRDVSFAVNSRQGDHSLEAHLSEQAAHRSTVFFLNPDCTWLYGKPLDAAVFHRPAVDFRHVKIGYWFWELDKIPAAWSTAIDKVDEIWVATEFVAEALRRVTDKPVIKIPPPVCASPSRQYDRAHFGLPEGRFLFLFTFDHQSYVERKNPKGLIRAFRQAFAPGRDDVALVIKSVNGQHNPASVAQLMAVADQDPRILLLDGFLGRDEVSGLYGVVDAFASLHRAEGFGLGLAESMFLGKPVIATGYSGNLEFMNADNSALVDYELVPVRAGEYFHDDPGFRWAQPDESHAGRLMRRLVDDPAWRDTLAARGRDHVRSHFTNAATAARIRARLGV